MAGSSDRAKEAAAQAAVRGLTGETRIALGTGSTAAHMVRALADRFPRGAGLTLVASSRATEELAASVGLPVRPLRAGDRFEVMLDGADEVSPLLDLTKGGGGALFREKFLARLSARLVIMVDPTKLVDHLGTRHRIPIEVVPFAREVLVEQLGKDGFDVALRSSPAGSTFRTDNGNEVLDLAPAARVDDPGRLDAALRGLPGVVETGIFAQMAEKVIVGFEDGRVEERRRDPGRGRRR